MGAYLFSHDEDQLPHHGRIYSQPGLRWFYKKSFNDSIESLREHNYSSKSKVISTITSSKRQRHTLHNKRYLFIMELKKSIPDLEVFGRGVCPVVDKSEVIDSYKYHIVIENFIGNIIGRRNFLIHSLAKLFRFILDAQIWVITFIL